MFNKIEKLSETEFTEVFGNIFENASWIAKKLYSQKPFKNFQNLSEKMISIFDKANNESKLKILNSHPDLADKTKIGSLTPDSNKEQSNAGLDQCTEEEFNEFKNLNLEYNKKFGFPFIIAVKEKSRKEILLNFKKRISYDKKIEYEEAIKQVRQIASLRLDELKIQFF
jgi:2-oxo-4-hydroxy-4-carboxy-5-ureidoimidazoline decarboxylase